MYGFPTSLANTLRNSSETITKRLRGRVECDPLCPGDKELKHLLTPSIYCEIIWVEHHSFTELWFSRTPTTAELYIIKEKSLMV